VDLRCPRFGLPTYRQPARDHLAPAKRTPRPRARSANIPRITLAIEIQPEVGAIGDEWDQLADRTAASPFVYPGWIGAWWGAFGDGQLEVLAIRRDGRLTAVMPVARRGGILASTTNWHSPVYGPVSEDEGALAVLVEALLERAPRRLDLSFLESSDPLLAEWRLATEASGVKTAERVIERSPYVEIDRPWEEFESRLPSRRRSKLRRIRRRLEEQGSVSIETRDGSERLEHLLDEGFQIEASGWKQERGTAIMSRPETLAFYREVARWASERGWLRLWFLRLDDRPIAFAYCLEQGEALYELKVGFDVDYGRFGPGVVLTQARLSHTFSAGLRSYEFLGQAERHKLDWTSTCRDRIRVQAFARTPAGVASRLLWTYGRPAAKWAMAVARR
jgi:CelD/BcsL family acetyltransferase involved in cellulose biosynthesis